MINRGGRGGWGGGPRARAPNKRNKKETETVTRKPKEMNGKKKETGTDRNERFLKKETETERNER